MLTSHGSPGGNAAGRDLEIARLPTLFQKLYLVRKGEGSQRLPNSVFIVRARGNSDRPTANAIFLEFDRSRVDICSH
jgi:hypothetical protein